MTLPLYYYVLGTPLGVLGLFRWGCWLVRRIPAVLYKPVVNDFRTSISIAVPVYQEDPIIFETAIQSWLANNVEEVILVIDQSDKVCQEIASRYPVTVVITDVPGKRDALVKGWNAASTELVALVDSDTIWAPDVAAEVCKPFADPRMGGVGTRQSVYGSTGLLSRLTDMFLDHRYFDENASQSFLGKAVSCLSGRTAVYRRSVLMEIQEEFMTETFWGVPCLSGDDKRLTTLTLEYGYLTYMQRTAQVWSTFPDSPRVFRKQRLRWARNTWRSDLRALSRPWVWRHTFLAYTMIDKALSGFTVLLGPIFMAIALISQNWIFAAVLALWWQISRSAKLLPHLYRRPSSFFFIPAYVVFSWVMAIIKIHALMTIRKQRWLTRQVAVENGEVVRTTGADENPAEIGAAADPLTQPLGQQEPVGFGASPVALTEPVATAAVAAAAAGAPRPYPHPHPQPAAPSTTGAAPPAAATSAAGAEAVSPAARGLAPGTAGAAAPAARSTSAAQPAPPAQPEGAARSTRMSTSTSRHWVRRLLAGATVATLVGIAAPAGAAGAAEAAPAALLLAQPSGGADAGSGTGSTGGTGAGTGSSGSTGGDTGSGSTGGGTGGSSGSGSGSGGDTSGNGNAGAGAGGNAEGQADAAASRAAAANEAAQEQADAERKAAKEKAQAERDAAEAARKAAEAQRKAAERAAKAAAQAAAAAAKARETWDRRGRPKKLIIVRATSIDAITNGSLTKRTPRSGSVTLQALGRIVPNSFLTIDGDTANLNAAVVLTPQTTLDISGVKTLKLGGGDSPTEAAFLYTGSGRILVDGVTVTSANKDGQPLAMSSQGRPYIVVSSRGRFEATDSTLSDLGVQPTGTDKGDPGISYNTDSTGALVRTQLLRNTTGAELSKSKNIKLEGVTAAESWSDGLLLQGDIGTTLTDIKAERNGGNGVTVTGESSEREIHNITTSGNHSYGVAVVGQNKAQVTNINATGDGAGGVRINRCTDCVVRDITTADQPIGLYMHVNTTNATLQNLQMTGGRRGIVAEKTTKGATITNSTIDGARVAGIAVGGHDVTLDGVSVSDSRTGVRIERGAGNVLVNGVKLSGGQDGLVTTAGTTGVVVKDMTADGVENDAVRNFSPGAQIIGGHINGGLTGIDAEAATTITGTGVSLSNEGIRARTSEPVTVDNVTVDAVTVGMNIAVGTPITLTNSRVHALEAVRGDLGPQAAGNDLSLPAINLLGAIGVPLIILALVLEGMHSIRQRRFGGTSRHLPPTLPATA